jgi:hypothetical protein
MRRIGYLIRQQSNLDCIVYRLELEMLKKIGIKYFDINY